MTEQIAPLSAVIVGAGFAGKCFHAYLISKEPRLKVSGFVVRDETKRTAIAAELGLPDLRFFSSIAEALSDESIKLVVIATPPESHHTLALEAMKAKRNVLVDKPLCLSLTQCDELIESSKSNGVNLFVFMNRRWDGDFLTARRLIDEGQLGQTRWIELAWQRPGIPPKDWKTKGHSSGGGRFFDLGAHLLDQLLLLLPSVRLDFLIAELS